MHRPRAELTFTLDLESDRASARQEANLAEITDTVLDALDAHGVRGTVFVLGEVSETHPALVKSIAARGHEIGFHGWSHRPLTEIDPDTLARDLARGRSELEDLTGQPVLGYRAPSFSLVPSSTWAIDLVLEAGFEYSSSIMPVRNPLFGFPACPATPFRWSNGLVELPCPVFRAGSVGVGYLGGVYLRLLPLRLTSFALGRSERDDVLWTYCHPYDFDADEPFFVMRPFGRVASRLMWVNRRHMLSRLIRLHEDRGGRPLRERVADAAFRSALPTFDVPLGAAR